MMFASRKIVYFGVAIVAIALAASVTIYFTSRVTAPGDSGSKAGANTGVPQSGVLQLGADDIRRAGIKVEKLEPAEFAETLAAFGDVGPNRNRFARVTSPVAGRLMKIAVDLGARVSEGATLATLDSPELADIRMTYQHSRTELDLAQTNLDRAQKLLVDASIAQKDVLRARSDYERARVALATVEAKLATLGVAATPPEGASPAFLAVTAPLAGTVVERTAVLGEFAQGYQTLFTVADLSTVWVEANLYDRDLAEVRIGAPATVTVNAYPDRRFKGVVTNIGNIIDKDTRTTVARIEVANGEGLLKPGLFANVQIEKTQHRNALRVPENAVVLLLGQMTVFVAGGHGFEPRPVEVGERSNGQVIIKSGLEAGDSVVVSGAYALKARLLKSQLGGN
ncbi:MAG: efflux RND transporter periplasmic adaptor subunit [Proteobacteria bacterium]|nr:efflux RND transporter periplasmic adaptor subunit [Pseudomonadota bacterium]